jgi:hypothetical protein
MSATGFTPISLYYTTTASAVPTAGNLVNGELALNINTADGKLFYKDSAGVVQVLATRASASGSFTNLAYTGTLTGGTGVVNLGSGQFYKDASGNVGIGTSSPSSKLEVSSATDTYLKITSTGNASSQFVLQGAGVNSAYNAIASNRSDTSAQQWKIGGVADAQTLPFFTGTTERMRIDSSGNVLIANSQLRVSAGSGNDYSARLSCAYNFPYVDTYLDSFAGASYSGQIMFRTNTGGGAMSERMRIDSSGNLLVGAAGDYGGLSSKCIIQPSSGTGTTLFVNTYSSTGTALSFYSNISGAPNAAGSITLNGGSTAYNTSSDYRLKENVAPMTGALARVAQLNPVTYQWKLDGSNGEGFIAHELQAVVPDCVTGKKDAVNEDGTIKPQGIDTSFLVATLTAAIQEQQVMIETLTTRLNALEGK